MRFLKSASDAWFNYATAAIAACGAWQNHISNQVDTAPAPKPAPVTPATPYEQAFTWWAEMFTPKVPAKQAPDFGAGFFQFALPTAAHSGFNPATMFNPFNAFAVPSSTTPNPWVAGWTEMMTAYSKNMPQFSWNIFQGPMTAWLMSAGLPYDVAVPTARGNTASMDAAVAARESFNRMYASFRTDGGHAVAPVLSSMPPPMQMFLAPYWTMAPPRLH